MKIQLLNAMLIDMLLNQEKKNIYSCIYKILYAFKPLNAL